ncbi:putative transporter [Verticillium dahliae VDG2]|nr:putative transporter [Verticillium dahliae VDG2]
MAAEIRPNIIFIMADDHAAKSISCYGAGINNTPNLDRLTNEGEGAEHEPTGFDSWSMVPGQGEYWDPQFIQSWGTSVVPGRATDIITDKCIDWMEKRDKSRPFFLMCHHKAPHRSWEYDEKHKDLYKDPIRLPDTFSDDYKNRARAATVAKMRVADDLTYTDLGIVQPEGPRSKVGSKMIDRWWWNDGKIPNPDDVTGLRLICKETGEVFTFTTKQGLTEFKFHRYMQRYLRTIQSIDDNVGRMLDWLDAEGLTENTVVVYTSDQGFFLGEHGWFDKRFMYEESFQMPFMIRYPPTIQPKSVCNDIICNVDFAPTFLDLAKGVSFVPVLRGQTPEDWQQIAYHRYWMHQDIIHEAYAHYGVRDQRYKLIYWYNEDFGLKGTRPGGEEKEWELFDCEEDPLELFNCYHEPRYEDTVRRMTRMLEDKMAEIGDEPVHTRLSLKLRNGTSHAAV